MHYRGYKVGDKINAQWPDGQLREMQVDEVILKSDSDTSKPGVPCALVISEGDEESQIEVEQGEDLNFYDINDGSTAIKLTPFNHYN